MLNIKFICVGRLRERFYIDAFEEYSKRLSAYCKLECVEINETKLPPSPSDKQIAAALDREADEIERAVGGDYAVALCIEGTEYTSESFAARLNELAVSGVSRLCFVVGGSYGLSGRVKRNARLRLSMSPMTFPHHLARVMLAEQIYRAFKINEGSKYHK